MKIYRSTEHMKQPMVGDLKLGVNSMWDFSSRDICFETIQKSFGGGTMVISYDLKECIEVKDGVIIGGTEKVKNTKWKQAEITKQIAEALVDDGYTLSKEAQEILNEPIDEILQMKGTLDKLNAITLIK